MWTERVRWSLSSRVLLLARKSATTTVYWKLYWRHENGTNIWWLQTIVFFDVQSLFTNIPLQLALDCTKTVIDQSTNELLLPTDDIMQLLTLCLNSTYFQYNSKHYKQLHGTAMWSPVSVVVAKIVKQSVQERLLPPTTTNEHYPLVSLCWRHHHCTTTGRCWQFPQPH